MLMGKWQGKQIQLPFCVDNPLPTNNPLSQKTFTPLCFSEMRLTIPKDFDEESMGQQK